MIMDDSLMSFLCREGIELPMIEGEERFLWVSKELDRLIRDYSSASSRIDAFDMGELKSIINTDK